MINFSSFFSQGLKNTLRVKNGSNLSYKGPWVLVYPDTVIDRWYVGDFQSAEYTIAVDLGNNERELIKCLLVAGPNNATVNVFGRSNLTNNLIDLQATVNSSYVSLIASPAIVGDSSSSVTGSKLIYSATYYYAVNSLVG
jgi:hypothetical protein